jgi:hypothetical protein
VKDYTSYDYEIGTGSSTSAYNKAPVTTWLSVQNISTVQDLVGLLHSETSQTKVVRYIIHIVREIEEAIPYDAKNDSLSKSPFLGPATAIAFHLVKRNRSNTSAIQLPAAKKKKDPAFRTKIKQEKSDNKKLDVKLEVKQEQQQELDIFAEFDSDSTSYNENPTQETQDQLNEVVVSRSRYGRVQKAKIAD